MAKFVAPMRCKDATPTIAGVDAILSDLRTDGLSTYEAETALVDSVIGVCVIHTPLLKRLRRALPGDACMTGAKCQRCGHYWAFAGNSTLFAVIARICPDCIAKALAVMGTAPTTFVRTRIA